MLPYWLQAYLLMLMEAWSIRRDGQIPFLKLQIELLRDKLPVKHVILSPEDRACFGLVQGFGMTSMISWSSSASRRTAGHDTRFTETFDELFKQAGAKAVATPIQAPTPARLHHVGVCPLLQPAEASSVHGQCAVERSTLRSPAIVGRAYQP